VATGSAIGVKIIAAGLLVGSASFGAGFVTGRTTAPGTAPPPPVASAVSVASSPAPVAPKAEILAPPVTSDEPAVRAALQVSSGPALQSPPVSASAGSTLWEESALLRDAQRALQGGDHAASLSILDRMAAKYPSGALEQERTVLRVLALCGSGRTQEAQTLGAQFLKRHPGSVLAARIHSSCASTPR
jgi:hypothetical protein